MMKERTVVMKARGEVVVVVVVIRGVTVVRSGSGGEG